MHISLTLCDRDSLVFSVYYHRVYLSIYIYRDDYDGTSIGSGWRGEYAYMDEYIPGSWICDGDVDCADTSDEASCWDYSGSSSGWLSGSGSGWWSGSGSGSFYY